jgi:hypothetical protein
MIKESLLPGLNIDPYSKVLSIGREVFYAVPR